MPLQATSGAASYDAFGGGVPSEPNYIESVFSCFLYTGNDTTQTITNGIDLSTKGGMVWIKPRNQAQNHVIFDTVGGITKSLATNNTNAQYTATGGNEGLASFNTTGFTAKLYQDSTGINNSACNLVSWTFRKQPKFFDVVTYNSGPSGTTGFSHNLGSVPATIFIKRTSSNSDWFVYHRSLGDTKWVKLNTTDAETNFGSSWITVTSTTVSTIDLFGANSNIVAYLFAHNAGGFGLTGTDNVISCGSFVTDGSGNATVNLGYEPQWLLTKQSSGAGGQDWYLVDTMRPWANNSGYEDVALRPNLSNADYAGDYGFPTATGFYQTGLNASATHIYIAIRRGPMKVPTSGTSVYQGKTYSGTGANATISGVGFSPDMVMTKPRSPDYGYYGTDYDRLRGVNQRLSMNTTDAESTVSGVSAFNMDGYSLGTDGNLNNSSSTYVSWNFRRAPSFFDEVCYTGLRAINNTTPQVVSHNLGVAPELVIFKCRSAATISSTATNWVTSTILNGVYSNAGYLNTNDSFGFSSNLNPADGGGVSASSITIGYGAAETNATGNTYVAYLFATCAGVSKVGSYTGNGTNQTINCGFTGGARFVLIKRTDSTGDWYVWDSARGIVAGNDPYLLLNSTAAEVTGTDYVDTYSAGFEISSTAPAAINANGGTFIFLAIA